MRNIISFLGIFGISAFPLTAELAENKFYQSGMNAMSMHLADVAVDLFKKASEDPSATDDDQIMILYRLAEAQVRNYNGREAEATLSAESLKGKSETDFWLAQALFVQGRNKEAAALFEKVANHKNSPRKGLALVALSELYKSLKLPEKAFEVLKKAAETQQLSDAANLKLIELYLDKKEIDEADKLMDLLDPKRPQDQQVKQYLLGRIALERGELKKASALFSEFTDLEELGGNLASAVLFAQVDVQFLEGKWKLGVASLIKFIEERPQSPFLYLAFNRLLLAMEADVDLSEYRGTISSWIEKVAANPSKTQPEDQNIDKFEFSDPDRDAFSRFLLAEILAQEDNAENLGEIDLLLRLLRKYHPSHSLSIVSWLSSAKNDLKANEIDKALKALDMMAQQAMTAELKAIALSLQASLKEQELDQSAAIQKLREILQLERGKWSEQAQVNIALIKLKYDDQSFDAEVHKIDDKYVRDGVLILKGEKDLIQGNLKARETLENLFQELPDHPSAQKARISLAKSYLKDQPLDAARAIGHLDVVSEQTDESEKIKEIEFLISRAKLLENGWESIIPYYKKQLGKIEASGDRDSEIYQKMNLSLGEAYYRNGEVGNAREAFNKIIQLKRSRYREHALFFSALAGLKMGTPQGKKDAEVNLESVVEMQGVYATEAAIHLARILIDSDRAFSAEEILKNRLKMETISKVEKFECRLLLADIYHRTGIQNKGENRLEDAISIYADLSKEMLDEKQIPWVYKILYLKGEAQEKLDLSGKMALKTYFSIINLDLQEDQDQPAEWDWYYKSGLRAVSILEKQERYKAAVRILEKMAGFFGPKSEILIEKVNRLKLEHHIF